MAAKDKKFSGTEEATQQAFRNAATAYREAMLSVLDAYNRHLTESAGWYQSVMGNFLKTTFPGYRQAASGMLKDNMNSYLETLKEAGRLSKEISGKILCAWGEDQPFAPISKDITDTLLGVFSKQAELFSDSGARFLGMLDKEENFKEQLKKFKDVIDNTCRTSGQTIRNLIDAYNTEAKFSREAGERLLVEITKQFDRLTGTGSKFLHDLFADPRHAGKTVRETA